MIMGIVSIMLINIVDTFYIGQIGVKELAAISFTFPVVFTVMSVAFGIGIGTSAVVSRAVGEGNHAQVRRLTTDSLYLTIIVMSVLSLIGIATIKPVFIAIGASDELLPIIFDYMFIWYLGVGLVAIPIVGNNAIRAKGDSKTPSLIMLVVAVTNAVLDPFLIFGLGPFPKLGVQGAALATVISYMCALVAGLWVLGRREKMLHWNLRSIYTIGASWQSVLYIGAPAAVTNMLAPVSTALLTKMVSTYGTDAVAAFGVGTRLESLAMIGTMALSSILTPFIGQNYGAHNHTRIHESLTYGIRFSFLWGAATCVLLGITAFPIASIFNDTQTVQSITRTFLWTVPLSFGFYGASMLVGAACNGLNRPLHSATINVTRLFFLILPLAWLGSHKWGLFGLFIGMCLGNILSGVGSLFWLKTRLLPMIK